jgi:hypothetical protein
MQHQGNIKVISKRYQGNIKERTNTHALLRVFGLFSEKRIVVNSIFIRTEIHMLKPDNALPWKLIDKMVCTKQHPKNKLVVIEKLSPSCWLYRINFHRRTVRDRD